MARSLGDNREWNGERAGRQFEIAGLAGNDDGTFDAATGARVFQRAARTINAGATFTGAGLFEITGSGSS